MPTDPGPYDLGAVRLVVGPRGNATPKAITPDFYAELDRDFDGFAGHVLVSQHSFTEPWGIWERHPNGDEIVYLLEGDADFHLRQDGQETTVRLQEAGTYILVPKGAWHTAVPRVPSVMLFFTPGEGTEHAEDPAF